MSKKEFSWVPVSTYYCHFYVNRVTAGGLSWDGDGNWLCKTEQFGTEDTGCRDLVQALEWVEKQLRDGGQL